MNILPWPGGRHRWTVLVGLVASMVVGSLLSGCGGDDDPTAELSGQTTEIDGTEINGEAATGAEAGGASADGSTEVIVAQPAGPASPGGVAAPADGATGDPGGAGGVSLASDPSGEVPGDEAIDGTAAAGDTQAGGSQDGDTQGSDGQGAASQGGASGGESQGLPEPDIDTDRSPDGGEVPSGVGGGTDDRENLAYPATPAVDLGAGSTIDLARDLAGRDRVTLLWFWSPDCPTCAPEAPVVADFARAHRGKIDVVAIGAGADRAEADAFADQHDLGPATLVWDPSATSHAHYNITVTPFVIMIDPGGVVMAQWRGMVPELFAFADRL